MMLRRNGDDCVDWLQMVVQRDTARKGRHCLALGLAAQLEDFVAIAADQGL
jgi:hypothetical protein